VRLAAEKERILLAEAVEQASEAFVIADADGRIQYINQGLRNIFGDVDDDIIGRDIGILYGDANDPASLKKMAQAMQSGSVQTDRLIVQPKKGKPINVEVTLFPIRDVYEKIINFVLILHDITREEYLEEQLRQAAKMQAVGRLAGGVAHDFNNQLTVIKGYCNLLLRDLQQDDPTWECVDQIDRAATQASSLTNELLTFSRKQILKPQVVSPNNVLQGMEKSLAMLGEDIRLIIRTAKDVGNVLVDPSRLEQTIMNLAINARDAMPDGGELIIETSNINIDDTYTTSQRLVKPGPHVMLSITDTGMGMDRQTTEKIFEPFFTTKEKGEGTGLGLAMVYGFVDQSDGHVDVTSKPNKGTCFRIFLPLVEADTNTGESIGSACPIEKGSETILVAEDDDAVRKLIVRVLIENGYTILETGDPTKAEGLVAELGRPIDLLVSDVVMPILNGPALADILRIKQPELKVLFVSGYTGQTTLKHGVNSNEIHFLHKPFTPDSLCRAVTRAISEQNHTPPDKQK
jgi:PAS domain S-box-containing protein